jgi:uncharacterized protein YkwD
MFRRWQQRLWIVAFFLGINIALGSYFLMEVRADLPKPLANLLYKWGATPREVASVDEVMSPKTELPNIAAELLLAEINTYREAKNLTLVKQNPQLTKAAEELLAILATKDYDTQGELNNKELEKVLADSGYNYETVSHNSLAGPKSVAAVMTAWFSDPDQIEALENPKFTDLGMAVALVDTGDHGQIGVVVQLIGQPRVARAQGNQQEIIQNNQTVVPPAREVSDSEVIEALNNYRASHGIYKLNVNEELCQYAAKRAQDLKAAGGLDGHAGFKQDFADQENLPVGIRDYKKGSKFTENLAHQYCKNMTTGESFVAQTGVALIEWCFDSSTKGHKEAQLSTESKNVCVRHADNMYVVIFGT